MRRILVAIDGIIPKLRGHEVNGGVDVRSEPDVMLKDMISSPNISLALDDVGD